MKLKERLVNRVVKAGLMREDKAAELSVGKLIGVLIFVVIAMALLPTIMSSVNAGVNATTGATKALVPLIGLFYVIAVLTGTIMWAVHEYGTSGT